MIRHLEETQRAFVEREIVEAGRISAYDCTYNLVYEDGAKCAITRLAAIVNDLRRDGWTIDTRGGHGRLATYLFISRPVERVVTVVTQGEPIGLGLA